MASAAAATPAVEVPVDDASTATPAAGAKEAAATVPTAAAAQQGAGKPSKSKKKGKRRDGQAAKGGNQKTKKQRLSGKAAMRMEGVRYFCGVKVTVAPMCMQYMKNIPHDPVKNGCTGKLHCPKAERPPCPLFVHDVCPWGDTCWYPHRDYPIPHDVNLAVQSPPSHGPRVAAYLTSMGCTDALALKHRGGNRRSDLLVVAKSPKGVSADDALADLLGNDSITRGISRVLFFDDKFEALSDAVNWLADQVAAKKSSRTDAASEATGDATAPAAGTGAGGGAGASGSASASDSAVAGVGAKDAGTVAKGSGDSTPSSEPVRRDCVRLITYPRRETQELGKTVAAHPGINLSAQGFEWVAYLAHLDGMYYIGMRPGSSFTGDLVQLRANTNAPCRAMYKIRECVDRFKVALEKSWTVIDVGASPGGWSRWCAERCAKVYAVDPGKLADPVPSNVEHMAIKAQDAVPELLKRGVTLDMYICDMNCYPKDAIEVFKTCASALRPGAPVVITLKKFHRNAHEWKTIVDESQASLAELCENIRVVHLMANSREERTLIATMKLATPAATPGATASTGTADEATKK